LVLFECHPLGRPVSCLVARLKCARGVVHLLL
jgi:hypothetical protein